MKEIVIKIPEKLYEWFKKWDIVVPEHHKIVVNAILDGTPLPKGHGELVDKKDLSLMTVHMIDGMFVCDAPTIIEADTERDCKTCGYSNDGKCAGTEECHECMFENKYIEANKGGEQE